MELFNRLTFVFPYIFLYFQTVSSQGSDDTSEGGVLIGNAVELFNPCSDGFFTMYREIGLRPSEENYWDGTIYLKTYKKYKEARIAFTLDYDAVVTVDPEIARIYATGRTFRITPYEVPDSLKFTVRAPQKKPFPNVISISVNEKPECKNLTKWENPTFIGVSGTAVGTAAQSSDSFNAWCGRRQIEHVELLTNAQETKHGDWPWHIALYLYNPKRTGQSYRCGGTIISRYSIVTAAHCVTNRGEVISYDLFLVVLGKYNLKGRDQGSQEREVSSVHVPEDFITETLFNDIAMLRLATQIEYNEYVQPICLWQEQDIQKEKVFGRQGTVVGWGLDEHEVLSEQLKAASTPIVTDVECLTSFPNFFGRHLNEKNFCAGWRNGTSACNGDSGGGLFLSKIEPDNKVSWYLRGIVSVSVRKKDKNICDPDNYVVFTDAAKYLEFIGKHK